MGMNPKMHGTQSSRTHQAKPKEVRRKGHSAAQNVHTRCIGMGHMHGQTPTGI